MLIGLLVGWAASVEALGAAGGSSFPGTGLGVIPDRTASGCGANLSGPPLNVSFNVSGLTSPVADVDVAFTVSHTWVGDLDVVLIAPNGEEQVLFSRTRATTDTHCGDSSNLAGTYVIGNEPTAGHWWVEAAARSDSEALSPAEYRSTQPGGAGQVDPAPETQFGSTFNGLPPVLANGTWTLRFRDTGQGDTGSVTAASLLINETCITRSISGGCSSTGGTAACGAIVIGSATFGPSCQWTATSGQVVQLYNDVAVEAGATLILAIDPGLSPLMAALQISREMAEGAPSHEPPPAGLQAAPNPDKMDGLDR